MSETSFDFGQNFAGSSVTKTVSTVSNTSASPVPLQTAVTGSAGFSVAGGGCGVLLGAGASCPLMVTYAPQSASRAAGDSAVLSLTSGGAAGPAVTVSGQSAVLAGGSVSTTSNPVVAAYSLTLPYAGSWSVLFGLTGDYGRSTNAIKASPGAAETMLVAGMQANSTYHMRATVTLPDGSVTSDTDHVFVTGGSPAGVPQSFPVTRGATGTPQSGIELVNPFNGSLPSTAMATDHEGNVIWSYPFTDRADGSYLYPVKQMGNGHLLCFIAPLSFPLSPPGQMNVMREFDLAGTTIREISMSTLNAALAKAGFNLTLENFSHDFTVLPTGHVLILTNTSRSFTDLPGYPGTTQVVGDVVVDLDAKWNPVWVWNEFDHLDVNRHPWMFPDWTHSNSVTYSKTDGNFLVSMRHQNWVVKVDYENGAGTGNILWRLGQGGDFELVGGTDPTDWFYAQHDATFASPTTSGTFLLNIMDNGDDRIFPEGVTCGEGDAPPCLYTTIQRLSIDETAKTATFRFHQILPPTLYSFFAGNVELLGNGDTEYDLAGAAGGAQIFEVTTDAAATTVWQMTLPGATDYRSYRAASLYPGVTW